MGILSGLKIVDVTYGTAGPLLTQVLADMGPDMIRVDVPSDRVRKQQGYQVRLRGRRSIALDLKKPEAHSVLERLIRIADILIGEPALDGKNTLPWSWPQLRVMNPRLVYCRISGYGDEGPEANRWANDHLIAARYGVYDQPGWRDGPTFLTAPVPSLGAALLSLQAIGSALYIRERTGQGQEVTTSLLAGALAYLPGMVSASGDSPSPDTGLTFRRPLGGAPFYSIYECADGHWLHFGCLVPHFQLRAMKAIDLDQELRALGLGEGRGAPPETRNQIFELITKRMKEKTFAEWSAIFDAQDVPHARSQWTEDLLDDPQVRHEGLVIEIDDPVVGLIEQMGPTILFGDAPADPPAPAPLPGQQTEAICVELGLSAVEIEALRASGAIAGS